MRIAIITQYFNSKNYGGNLQSYALEYYINLLVKENDKCEQICYIQCGNIEKKKLNGRKRLIAVSTCYFRKIYKLYLYVFWRLGVKKKKRYESIVRFNKGIKHSKEIYTKDNIVQANNQYDVFITGSDQVWNPIWYDENYWLNFVSAEKTKLSYAAGISAKELTERQKQLFSKSLKTYDAISVREESSVDLIQPLTKTKVEWVLDPTLLLSSEDWNQICPPRRVPDKYVFCYFLGGIARYRKIVKQFAKAKKLKIVTLPYLGGALVGENFGDYRLFDVSPADFISLIKNAEYVFTDSFHAAVFSHIYQRDFFVFSRKGYSGMGDRIYSLTSLFDTQERFCDTQDKVNIDYIMQMKPIDYQRRFDKFEEQKEKSLKFLRENLGKAKQKLKND